MFFSVGRRGRNAQDRDTAHDARAISTLRPVQVGLHSVDKQLTQLLMPHPVFILTHPRVILRHLAPRALLHLTYRVARDTRAVDREIRRLVFLLVEYDPVLGRAALFKDTHHFV